MLLVNKRTDGPALLRRSNLGEKNGSYAETNASSYSREHAAHTCQTSLYAWLLDFGLPSNGQWEQGRRYRH